MPSVRTCACCSEVPLPTDAAVAHAGVSDEDFTIWLNDCSDLLCVGGRPKIGDVQALDKLGARLDLAMQTPSMILLEPSTVSVRV